MKIRLLAAAALVATAFASPSQAVTIVQNVQFGPAPTDYNGTGPGQASLNFFNSNLGTLQSVDVTVTYGFTSNITLQNNAQGASSGTARAESASGFASTTSGVNTFLNSNVNYLGPITVGGGTIANAAFDSFGTNRTYSLASGASTTVASNGSTQTYNVGTLTDATSLATFSLAGGGSFLVQLLSATGTLLSNSGGNTSASEATIATGTFAITYNYAAATAAVPEPATWAMMIVGFGLIGATLRRRQPATTVRFAR